MAQERPRVRIEKKQYFDRNIWDMSIDITYFVLDILQVVISRSTYYISFKRMCLTVYTNYSYFAHDIYLVDKTHFLILVNLATYTIHICCKIHKY